MYGLEKEPISRREFLFPQLYPLIYRNQKTPNLQVPEGQSSPDINLPGNYETHHDELR